MLTARKKLTGTDNRHTLIAYNNDIPN